LSFLSLVPDAQGYEGQFGVEGADHTDRRAKKRRSARPRPSVAAAS
jgi:hypothetical protein